MGRPRNVWKEKHFFKGSALKQARDHGTRDFDDTVADKLDKDRFYCEGCFENAKGWRVVNSDRAVDHLAKCKGIKALYEGDSDPHVTMQYLRLLVAAKQYETVRAAAERLQGAFLRAYNQTDGALDEIGSTFSAPSTVGPAISHAGAEAGVAHPAAKRARLEEGSVSSVAASSPGARQASILSFGQRPPSKPERSRLDQLYAKAVHLEHNSFAPFKEATLAFVNALNPAYKLPAADAVSGYLLDKHCNQVQGPVEGLLTRAASVGLSTDGWTDKNGDGLHNVMACFPLPFLLRAVRHPGLTDTTKVLVQSANNMVDEMLQLFKDANKKPPILIGFVTDSPNANKGARTELEFGKSLINGAQQADFSARVGLVPYGCVCHALNNVGKWIYAHPGLQLVHKDALVLAKVFRNVTKAKHRLAQVVRRTGASAALPVVPVETRWNSNVDFLSSVFKNKDAMRQVKHELDDEEDPDLDLSEQRGGQASTNRDAHAIISDNAFWKRLETTIQLLQPIADLVTYLEGDTTPISMLAAGFVKLFRCYAVLARMEDDDSFPYSKLGLKPADFADVGETNSARRTFPQELRRFWNTVASHRVKLTAAHPVGRASGVLQLAMWLDSGTRGLAVLADAAGISLDPGRTIYQAVLVGAEFVAGRWAAARGRDVAIAQADAVQALSASFLEAKNEISLANNCDSPSSCSGDNACPTCSALTSWWTDPRTNGVVTNMMMHPLMAAAAESGTLASLQSAVAVLPASAAGGERSFSVYGKVHTALRNKMRADKLDKMVMVRMNSGQLKRQSAHLNLKRSKQTFQFFYSANHADRFSARDCNQQQGAPAQVDLCSSSSDEADDEEN